MAEPFDKTRACAYAMRLLAAREYCEAQMRERLLRWCARYDMTCSGEQVDEVLARLRQSGALDESRFVRGFFRMRLARGDTPRLAAMKARQKGAMDDVVAAECARLQASFDAPDACRHLLERRDPAGRRFSDARAWRRHARYLQQKGFDTATILRVMKGEPEQ